MRWSIGIVCVIATCGCAGAKSAKTQATAATPPTATVQTTTPAMVHVEKPPTVTREQWGSTPQPMPDSRRHTPKYITIHHAGVEWKTGRDPAAFVKTMQTWGQRRRAGPTWRITS